MTRSRIRRLLAITAPVTLAAAVALGTPGANAATGSGADFAPDLRPRQLSLQLGEPGSAITVHWRGHDRVRVLRWYDVDPVDDRSFTDVYGSTVRDATGMPGAARNVQLARNVATVSPDGWSYLDGEVMGYAWPLIARVRSGGQLLVATAGGRRVLRGSTRLAANECAGLERGTRVVDLDPATLVPRRIVDRRGGRIDRDIRVTPRRVRATDTAPARIIGRQLVRDDRFQRRESAAWVAARVAYPVAMPTSLPAGFTLGHVGNAPLGGRLGPEGSFPQSRGVFFARWSHGLETLDLTIRPARSTLTRDWDQSDPFGAECTRAATTDVMVGTSTATYAQGEFGSPRLWWRDGTTLYTLSGPFAAEQLATVARSLVATDG